MNALLVFAFLAVIVSVTGAVVKSQEDSDGAASYQGWATVNLVSQGHDAHQAVQAHAHEAALWKAKELSRTKALADQHANVTTEKAKAAAEEQSRALAFQHVIKAKASADKEKEQALWKAKEAFYEEYKALTAAQVAGEVAKRYSYFALDAQNATEGLRKTYLAAKARAEEEVINAAEMAAIAQVKREQAALATQAKIAAEELASIATKISKSAEESVWKAKKAAW